MELRQLKHLLALVETGSFSRAAERLHITQSALSRSIQGLETALGGALIDRIGKRNEPTPLGLTVAEHARQVLHGVEDLNQAVRHQREGRMRSLRLGLGSGPGALLMTPLLQHMAQHQPGVPTEVTRGATDLQLQALRHRELDALVVDIRRVPPAADLRIEQLVDMQAGFICRREHPLAQREQLPFTALLDHPIASTPLSDEVARRLVGLYGETADPSRLVTLRCEEVASLIDTVRHTNAIFLGIRAAAFEGLASGELVDLPVTPRLNVTARFALVTLAGRTESPALGFLRGFVADHLQDKCPPKPLKTL